MVVTERPRTRATGVTQDTRGWPSTQTVQQPRRTGLGSKAVYRFHSLIKEMQVRLILVRFTGRYLGLNVTQLCIAIHDVIDRGTTAVWAFLRDVCNLVLGIERQFAVIRLQFTE